MLSFSEPLKLQKPLKELRLQNRQMRELLLPQTNDQKGPQSTLVTVSAEQQFYLFYFQRHFNYSHQNQS